MKFQPGQVVHVVAGGNVISCRIDYAVTKLDGTTAYRLNSFTGDWFEQNLFATFDNAMAELKRQNEEGK